MNQLISRTLILTLLLQSVLGFTHPIQAQAKCWRVFQPVVYLLKPFSRKNRLSPIANAPLFVENENAKAKTLKFFTHRTNSLIFGNKSARKKMIKFIESIEVGLWDENVAQQVYNKPKEDVLVLDAILKIEELYTRSLVKKPKLGASPAYLTAKKIFIGIGIAGVSLFLWANAQQIPVNLSSGFYQPTQAESQRLSYAARASAEGLTLSQRKLQVLDLSEERLHQITDKLTKQAIVSNSSVDFVENDARDRFLRISNYVTLVTNTLRQITPDSNPKLIEQQIILLTQNTLTHYDIISGPMGSVLLDAIEELFLDYDPDGIYRQKVYQKYF